MRRQLTTRNRSDLICDNIEHIEMVYDKAQSNSMDEPVVFVLGLNDPMVRGLYDMVQEGRVPTGHTQKVIDEMNRDGLIPTGYTAFPRSAAVELIREAHRDLNRQGAVESAESAIAKTLEYSAPEGHFWVVAWGDGKALAALRKP